MCNSAGSGDQRTLTPKPICPLPTPQPRVPLLGFVSGETRQIQPGPAQPVCKNSPLPCALPPTPQGPTGSHPYWELGPRGALVLRDRLEVLPCWWGQGWPQGGAVALGGPWEGWEIVGECYQPIVCLTGQGRAIKGCPWAWTKAAFQEEPGWAAWHGRFPLEPAFSSASSPSSPLVTGNSGVRPSGGGCWGWCHFLGDLQGPCHLPLGCQQMGTLTATSGCSETTTFEWVGLSFPPEQALPPHPVPAAPNPHS